MKSRKPSSHSNRDYERELETDRSDFDCAERALWYNVIMQAITDAMKLHNKNKYKRRDANAAIDWLLGDSEDYRTVCSLAGFDPDYLRRKVTLFLSWKFALSDDGSFHRPKIET